MKLLARECERLEVCCEHITVMNTSCIVFNETNHYSIGVRLLVKGLTFLSLPISISDVFERRNPFLSHIVARMLNLCIEYLSSD